MSSAPSNPAAEEPLLRPRNCPRCDYSLLGLPAVGVCPECGRAYDTTSVFLYGNALGQRANAWNRKPMRRREMIATSLPFLMLLAIYIFSRLRLDYFMAYFLPATVIPLVTAIFRSQTDSGSGVVQVRLTPIGFHQGTRQLGPIPYERCDRARLTPWSKKTFVTLTAKTQDRVEIQISPRYVWWKYQVEPVHAEVACTSEELEVIQARIAAWRNERSVLHEAAKEMTRG
jgi:hypothetical protein